MANKVYITVIKKIGRDDNKIISQGIMNAFLKYKKCITT